VVSAITYFSLASNLGFTGVAVEFVRYNDSRVAGFVRQVFWVRYIQYFINISLIVISLLLTARVPAAQILFTVFAAATTVVCMLVGALVRNRYKWGYFTFGLFIFLYVIYAIFLPGRRFSGALGSDVGRAFNIPAFWTLAILLLYPIAWGVSGMFGNITYILSFNKQALIVIQRVAMSFHQTQRQCSTVFSTCSYSWALVLS
jgi:bacteriorhodopsin